MHFFLSLFVIDFQRELGLLSVCSPHSYSACLDTVFHRILITDNNVLCSHIVRGSSLTDYTVFCDKYSLHIPNSDASATNWNLLRLNTYSVSQMLIAFCFTWTPSKTIPVIIKPQHVATEQYKVFLNRTFFSFSSTTLSSNCYFNRLLVSVGLISHSIK